MPAAADSQAPAPAPAAAPAASTPIPTPAPPVGEGGGGDAPHGDPHLPDESGNILDAFGLEGDWGEAMRGLETRLSAHGAGEGQASAPAGASAAEGVPGVETPAPATPAAPPAGASQPPQSGPAPAAPQAPAPAAASGGSEPAARVQALEAQVQALQALIAQAQQQPASAQPAGGQPPQQQPSGGEPQLSAEQLTDYRYAIPNDVLSAIESDDPNTRSAGLHHLVNNFAKVTHLRVIQHVDQLLNERLSQERSSQTVNQQQQEMMQDYYGAFPAHSDPLNRIVVAMEAQAMWKENPALAWSEETRNALGARVNQKLGLAAQAQQQQQAPQAPAAGNGAAPPKPAAMTGASTRPQASQAEQDGNTIRNILSAL